MPMRLTARTLIKKSFALYRAKPLVFLEYMIALLIPTLIFAFMIPTRTAENTGIVLILNILSFFVLFWCTIPVYHVVYNMITGRPIRSFVQELRESSHVLLSLIWGNILAKCIIFVWIALFLLLIPRSATNSLNDGNILGAIANVSWRWLLFLPAFFFSLAFQFVNQSIIFDRYSGSQSLGHSLNLFMGRWLGVIWRILAPLTVFIALSLVMGWLGETMATFLAQLFSGLEPSSFLRIESTLKTIFSNAFGITVLPLILASPTILYLYLLQEDREKAEA